MTITHAEMVARLVKTGDAIIAGLTPETMDMLHAAVGVSGEAGELLDAVKKVAVYNKPVDRENIVEELGDLEFYMEQIRQRLGVTREETLAANIREPAFPIFWGKNQKGMRADEEIADNSIVKYIWQRAMEQAVGSARILHEQGLHKALVNRIIEPFTHMVCLVSATEWDNFLELRDHPDAEPHIQMLAREIRKCLEDESTIQTLYPGEWHLPFVQSEDHNTLADNIKLSVARCASTSYKTVDGFDMTLDRAIALHDKLVSSKPIHASPAEHVAQADDYGEEYHDGLGAGWEHPNQHGNFVGFCQYRHILT